MDLVRRQRPVPMDLWDAFDGLRGEMYDAFDIFRTPDVPGLFDHSAAPSMDVIEGKDEYLVLADIPGVKKDDLDLSVTGTLLCLKGEVKAEKDSEKRKIFRKESWIGSFKRTIDLPAMAENGKISAELKDGVLAVKVPKRDEAKPRLIDIAVK
jgi:HSP20 family protein